MALELTNAATKFNVAVVLMNQVTTKIDSSNDSGKGQIVAALGEPWSHVCTNRILLTLENDQRWACLVKSSSQKPRNVEYEISQLGIRRPSKNAPKRKSLPCPDDGPASKNSKPIIVFNN